MKQNDSWADAAEREAVTALDRMVMERYPKAAKAYAALSRLEMEMLEPDAPKNRRKWDEDWKKHSQLDKEFWQVMRDQYGIEQPARRGKSPKEKP